MRKKARSAAARTSLAAAALVAAVTAVLYAADAYGMRERIQGWAGEAVQPQEASAQTPQPEKPADQAATAADKSANAPARKLSTATIAAGATIPSAELTRTAIPAGASLQVSAWLDKLPSGTTAAQRQSLASLLLEAAVRGGLEFGGRHLHLALPAGVHPGFDVHEQSEDPFMLYNPYPFDVSVMLSATGGNLEAAILGAAPDDWQTPVVTVRQESFPAGKLSAADAARRLDAKPGKPGTLVEVYADGELLYKDFYAPVPAYRPESATAETPPATEPALTEDTGKEVTSP